MKRKVEMEGIKSGGNMLDRTKEMVMVERWKKELTEYDEA